MRLAFTHVCGRVYKQFVYHLKIASTMKRILCVVETIQSTGIRQKLRTSSQTRDEFELLLAQRHQIDILQISLLNNSINRIEHLAWRRADPQNHHFSSIRTLHYCWPGRVRWRVSSGAQFFVPQGRSYLGQLRACSSSADWDVVLVRSRFCVVLLPLSTKYVNSCDQFLRLYSGVELLLVTVSPRG